MSQPVNIYYDKLVRFRESLSKQVTKLFASCGNELSLTFGEYNLLQRKGNCIESSTAVGYLLEEFMVSNLEDYSKTGETRDFSFYSYADGTSTRSFDCYATFEGLKILINIKTEKTDSTNDAVAAVRRMVADYCSDDEDELAYLVLKVRYEYLDLGRKRRIGIVGAPVIHYLEEYDYSRGHFQDQRNWSSKDSGRSRKGNNGRLQLTSSFMNKHKMPPSAISHELTKKQLKLLNTEEGTYNTYVMPEEGWPKEETE